MSVPSVDRVISFGPYRLHPERRLLLEGNQPLRLGTRALEILIALIDHAGERVSKDELIARVWPDTTVDEVNLRVHVSALRRALGDGRDGNRYILTDAGRGYRFTAPITLLADTGTLQPATKHRHNLPAMLTRLIGRADTVNMLTQQLPQQRFVTLVGSGGVGTTSVALAAAESLLPSYEDGVWLVDFAPLADPRLVPNAVAAAIGLNLRTEDLQPSLIAALRDKQMLLVLDNCEHVIDATASFAVAILKNTSRLHILATSREPLRAEGEHVRRLQPLATPPSTIRLTAARALAFPAVQLFVERAAAQLPEFELSDADAPVLADICAKLDGIPLAIEFAAARVDVFGIRGVAARLDDRLRLLTIGRRTALPRHQTMRATLDWSYEALPEIDRLVLQRLGIFVGRFTLEGASKVVTSDEVPESETADCIGNLVAKSLVTADVGGTLVLYRLLGTTRAYAREKLAESGTLELISKRHAEYYRDLLEGDEAGWGTTSPAAESINKDRYCIDDIRAALNWAFSPGGDPSIGVALTASAIPLWMEMSLMAEARERVERALFSTDPGQDRRREMQLQAALGTSFFFSPGSSGFATAASRVLELADSLDDIEYQLGALWRLWSYRTVAGEYRSALALAQKFRGVAARARESSDRAIGDRLIGITFHYLGEQAEARRYLEAMLKNYDPDTSASDLERFQVDQRVAALATIAKVLWLLGLPDQAGGAAKSAVDEAGALNHPNSLCYALAVAACPVALFNGDVAAAEHAIDKLRDQSTRHEMALWHTWSAGFEGALHIYRGDHSSGVQLLRGALDELHERRYFVPVLGFLGELAQGLGRAGRVAEGLTTIGEALDRANRTDEHWSLAELLRIKGELILLDGSDGTIAVAEDLFAQSLAWAQKQEILSWTLRTAVGSARLSRTQGRSREAHELLTSVYGRFTEGFETADLRTAQRLIGELH